MKWTPGDKYLQSDCGQFRITNSGKRGGDKYCLYQFDEFTKCYSRFVSMGTAEDMKRKAEGL